MAEPGLAALILNGREERNLEYKGPISWGSVETRGKLTKTILGLSNIQDGGAIVIGVEQDGERFRPVRLDAADRDSFKQDDVSAFANEYAGPFVQLSVVHVQTATRRRLRRSLLRYRCDVPVCWRRHSLAG